MKESKLNPANVKVFIGDPSYALDGADYKKAVTSAFTKAGKPQDKSVVGYLKGNAVTEFIKVPNKDYTGTDNKTYATETGFLGVTVFNPGASYTKWDEEILNHLGKVINITDRTNAIDANVQFYEGNVSITVSFDGKSVYDVDIKIDDTDTDEDDGPDYIEYENGYRDYQDDYEDDEGHVYHRWAD